MLASTERDHELGTIIRLYRVMCEAEYASLVRTRRFSTTPGAVEGKRFAESAEHGALWGRWFESVDGIAHNRIAEATLPARAVEAMIRYPHLDGIGPAVFATLHQLRGVEFREVKHD